MSISKSQAEALAEQFLDDLGTETKDELQPKETYSELFILAGEFVDDAQANLKKDNTNATGKLSASLKINEPYEVGDTVIVEVMMNEYGKYINKGVRGTKSGMGDYSFKHEFPSRKMVARMLLGIRAARKATKNVNAKKSVSKNEIKNASLAEMSHAWGAARKVKQHGIKATGFLDKAVKTTSDKIADRLGKAFAIDILNSI